MNYIITGVIMALIIMIGKHFVLRRMEKDSVEILNRHGVGNINRYTEQEKKTVAKWKVSSVVTKMVYVPFAFIIMSVFYSHFEPIVTTLAVIYLLINIGLGIIARDTYKKDYDSFFKVSYEIKRLGSEHVRKIIEKLDRQRYGRTTLPVEANEDEVTLARQYIKLFNISSLTGLTMVLNVAIMVVIYFIV